MLTLRKRVQVSERNQSPVLQLRECEVSTRAKTTRIVWFWVFIGLICMEFGDNEVVRRRPSRRIRRSRETKDEVFSDDAEVIYAILQGRLSWPPVG